MDQWYKMSYIKVYPPIMRNPQSQSANTPIVVMQCIKQGIVILRAMVETKVPCYR